MANQLNLFCIFFFVSFLLTSCLAACFFCRTRTHLSATRPHDSRLYSYSNSSKIKSDSCTSWLIRQWLTICLEVISQKDF